MLSFAAIIIFIFPPAFAQYGGGYGGGASTGTSGTSFAASSTSSSAQATVSSNTHVVNAGQNGMLAFSPDIITAAMGDKIEFHFFPTEHSVTQGTFDNPCQPINSTAGFFSGFMPVASGEGSNMFTVTVNDTAPIWFYCAQTVFAHCQHGMSGVINPPSDGSQTLSMYQNASQGTTSSSPASVQGGVVSAVSGSTASTSISSSGTSSATTGSPTKTADAPLSLTLSLVTLAVCFFVVLLSN